MTTVPLVKLLQLARARIQARVLGLEPAATRPDPELSKRAGSFVSLWVEGELRGCMGQIEPEGPLDLLVERMADRALADPRFLDRRVTVRDLPRLQIEVSILSALSRASGPKEILIGEHGVVVTVAGKTGCFLPQVAKEQGWDGERLLEELCRHKLDLPSGSWRLPGARIQVFRTLRLREGSPPTA